MITLSVNMRAPSSKGARALRHQGIIPGVVYGHGIKNMSVAVDEKALSKVYRQVGESTLFDLVIDGQTPVKVLIQAVQRHPISGLIQHVDFHQVRMDEKLEVDIPLKYTGESPAVKELGGILVKAINQIKIKCLPQDLVHEIEVDLSALKQFNDVIALNQIRLPQGLEIIAPSGDEVLVTVTPPRSEAELAELKAEVKEDVASVKVEEKGKTLEEAAAGEAKADQADKAKSDKK